MSNVLRSSLLLFLFLTTLHSTLSAQSKEVSFLIDTCITIMKQNAHSAGKVDWHHVKTNALAKAKDISDPYQLGPVMRYIYASANDFHGAFFYKDSTYKWRRDETPVPDSVMKEWKKGVSIKRELLRGDIGYLRMPYISFAGKASADTNAQRLNDSLCFLLQKNVKGIILDLRLNGGGTMYPMMLGVEQLLGTGKIGSFIASKGESWYIKDHNFLLDTATLASISPQCAVNTYDLPVAVLIGRGTGSSGEFLTMAFKGRRNTVFIGSETAGYVTVVGGYPINNAAYMYLSTGYGADRTGKVYKQAIKPDITVSSPDSFNDIENDEKVKAAKKWIMSHMSK